MNKITNFEAPEHAFLSNFYEHEFLYCGTRYKTAEHAYQAQKFYPHYDLMAKVINAETPGKAKRLGRKPGLRADWEDVKVAEMTYIIIEKFKIPELRDKLLATGDSELIEGNTWGDKFWGVYNGVGRNELGKILMRIRADLAWRIHEFTASKNQSIKKVL